ncbi:MAG: hypothetical protein WBR56_10325 [Sedimenticolaceae bacterium]
MRPLLKLSLLLLLLSPIAIVATLWLALSSAPLVTQHALLSHQDIARAKAILQSNDPRRLPPGSRRTIELKSQDLDLAADYLLQTLASGNSELTLSANRLDLRMTLRLPRLPARHFLNIDGSIEAIGGRPVIRDLVIGKVPIPGGLANWLAEYLLRGAHAEAPENFTEDVIQGFEIFPDRLRLTYRWHPQLLDQARDTLLTGGDRAALRYYHDLLVRLQSQGVGRTGSVVALLQSMFAAAQTRSRDGDPIAENKAMLTVLGTWASGRDVANLVPGNLARPQRFRLKLEQRRDFAQHFLSSAALAARGDTSLSNAVGLFKEIVDIDHGSGFSFTDIAADRAGTRFGELATRSAEDADRVQRLLADGVEETAIMPPARDLPEHLNTQRFKELYGHVGSPAYQLVMRDIERRIAACSLYRL